MKIKIKFNKKELLYDCRVEADGGEYIIRPRELQKIIFNQIRKEEAKRGSYDYEQTFEPMIGFVPK